MKIQRHVHVYYTTRVHALYALIPSSIATTHLSQASFSFSLGSVGHSRNSVSFLYCFAAILLTVTLQIWVFWVLTRWTYFRNRGFSKMRPPPLWAATYVCRPWAYFQETVVYVHMVHNPDYIAIIIIIVYWTLTSNTNIWAFAKTNALDIFPYQSCLSRAKSISVVFITWEIHISRVSHMI